MHAATRTLIFCGLFCLTTGLCMAHPQEVCNSDAGEGWLRSAGGIHAGADQPLFLSSRLDRGRRSRPDGGHRPDVAGSRPAEAAGRAA
jgi:hypothetical protein